MSRRRDFLPLAALLGWAALAVGGTASAGPAAASPRLEITVIYAAHSDAGVSIDPALRDLPQLTRDQPFVRYNLYKLLERTQQPLETGKPDTYGIVNGRTLEVTLLDVTTTPTPHSERRYRVRAAIGDPGKQDFLKLLEVTAGEGEPFFVGGQSYQGGTLFLELVVR